MNNTIIKTAKFFLLITVAGTLCFLCTPCLAEHWYENLESMTFTKPVPSHQNMSKNIASYEIVNTEISILMNQSLENHNQVMGNIGNGGKHDPTTPNIFAPPKQPTAYYSQNTTLPRASTSPTYNSTPYVVHVIQGENIK